MFSTGGMAAPKDLQEWIDLPVEVHDALKRKLTESKKYTEEQLETITECLDKSEVQSIINCLSDDGMEDTLEIGDMIRDEMGNLRDKVCGGGFLEKDRCKKLENDLKNVGIRIKDKWSRALASGKAFLDKRYELTRLKRKICNKIDQKGCWSWLNERMDLHCKPGDFSNDADKLKQCRMQVAEGVWEKVKDR